MNLFVVTSPQLNSYAQNIFAPIGIKSVVTSSKSFSVTPILFLRSSSNFLLLISIAKKFVLK